MPKSANQEIEVTEAMIDAALDIEWPCECMPTTTLTMSEFFTRVYRAMAEAAQNPLGHQGR